MGILINSRQYMKMIRDKVRILEAATAKAWSHVYLQIQKFMFSGGEFTSPSAELNRVCNTSPLKLWHSLSNICRDITLIVIAPKNTTSCKINGKPTMIPVSQKMDHISILMARVMPSHVMREQIKLAFLDYGSSLFQI